MATPAGTLAAARCPVPAANGCQISNAPREVSWIRLAIDLGAMTGTVTDELKACEDVDITTYVPKPMTRNAKAEGRFDKSDFVYIAKDDEYQCPSGQRASTGSTR